MCVPEESQDDEVLAYGSTTGSRLIVGLFSLNFLWTAIVLGQPSSMYFGGRADAPIVLDVRAFAVTPATPAHSAEIAILPASAPYIIFFRIDSSGALVPSDTCPVPAGQDAIVAADLDGEGHSAYVTLDGSKGEVHILRHS